MSPFSGEGNFSSSRGEEGQSSDTDPCEPDSDPMRGSHITGGCFLPGSGNSLSPCEKGGCLKALEGRHDAMEDSHLSLERTLLTLLLQVQILSKHLSSELKCPLCGRTVAGRAGK